jgi:hypothetical protein
MDSHDTEGGREGEVCCSIVAGVRLTKRFRAAEGVSEGGAGAGLRTDGREGVLLRDCALGA